eukprot:TRINITY_DN5919_c0_g1_i2.p1 TRINITY_DN5919_c0_g1~~TRINITY_DN5919_c0_g1_i2.p1  ORF type:complete len:359 (-),score=46.95 TRINITY_DN5919_c0_g1_i2:529-1605(-)
MGPNITKQRLIHLPVDWLKQISLVDTPGTNAVIKDHQQITQHFVPRSDLILFVTSTDRTFSYSEKKFLELVKDYNKKIVVVLSKIDQLETEQELAEITKFISENSRTLLSIEPLIFPVSSKKALAAKQSLPPSATTSERQEILEKNDNWLQSQFGELENYILKTLDVRQRAILKMKNPLGVAERYVRIYKQQFNSRLDTLMNDVKVLEQINKFVSRFRIDMTSDFQWRIDKIDSLLFQMSERGSDFIDNKMRFGKLFELLNSSKTKLEFEKVVTADTKADIERSISEIIDWFLDKNIKLWNKTVDYLHKATQNENTEMARTIETNFRSNRANLLEGIGQKALNLVSSYNKEVESERLA